MKHTSGASGVAARPPTAVQTQVAIVSPLSNPTVGPNSVQPICLVSKHVPMVNRAEPRRAPVSLRPQTAKPAIWIQFTNGGFSMRSRPLNVGTIQSLASSMATEQAAFFGSSSSQSAGPPSRNNSTAAAVAAINKP